MKQRYNCNQSKRAIYTYNTGFMFGSDILSVISDTTLNQHNHGVCWTRKDRYYDIEGDASPLTNQKDYFTCAQLEVYKVIYN